MNSKICFFFNSRNNYHLYERMFFSKTSCDLSKYQIFNVDIDSSPEQKEYGKQLCKELGIIDIEVGKDPNIASVYRTFEYLYDYLNKNNIDMDWVCWWSQDNYITDKDFMVKFEDFVYKNEENINEKVGVIGVAVKDIVHYGQYCYGMGGLIKNILKRKYDGWYQKLPPSWLERDYFVVEATCSTSAIINAKLYKKYIKPDYNFKLFYWGCDLSYQYSMNNIASITMPKIHFVDGWREKPNYGVVRAYDSCLMNSNYFHLDNNLSDHVRFWKEKWKFDLASQNVGEDAREQIKSNFDMYRNTLIEKVYSWDIEGEPKSLKDLE